MKVDVCFTVDVDVSAWCATYDLEPGEVPEDAQDKARDDLTEHWQSLGLLIPEEE